MTLDLAVVEDSGGQLETNGIPERASAMGDVFARPTIFDRAIADRICERLSQGANLRQFCVWPYWPTKKTVIQWTKQNPEFGRQYRNIIRAREKASAASFEASTRDHAHARV